VALSWIVFSQTHDAIDVTFLGLANFVPGLVIGLLAGVMADRFDRRGLMLRADLVRAAAIGALAVLLVVRGFDLLTVLVAVAVVSALSAVFRPASNAILPTLVPGSDLADANGLLFSGQTLGNFAGSAIGGVFVVTVGAVGGFSLNAFTYAISAAMIFLLVVPRSTAPAGTGTPGPKPSYLADLSEGFRFVRSRPALLWTILASLVANFFLAFYLLYLVVFVPNGVHAGATVYGIAVALSAIGFGAGSLVVGRWGLVRRAGWTYILGWTAAGVVLLLLGLFPSVPFLLVATPAFGVLGGVGNTAYLTCVQRIVPGPMLGRFFAIDEVASFAVIPLGQVVGGILVVMSGVVTTFVVAGVGTTVSAAVLLLSREARELSDVLPPPPTDGPDPPGPAPVPAAPG
jgi:predicted MFS family arabinose efflux permease